MDYKRFIFELLREMPKGGHGQFRKIAHALGVHTTMVTHIFKGHLHLGAEQSLAMAEFLGLSEFETQYFINLVHLARAGDQRTKKFYAQQLSILKEKTKNLQTRLEVKNALDEADQAIYYSSWIYSAIRLLSAIPRFQSASAIAEELNLPISRIRKALDFLLSRKLCEEQNGKIVYSTTATYLDSRSPLVTRHHVNWRLKVIEQMEKLTQEELAYTYPVVISEEDFPKLREVLIKSIEQFKKIADPSKSEKLYCFNVDWVEIKNR